MKSIGPITAVAGRVMTEDASRNFLKLWGQGTAFMRFWTSLVSESIPQAARACSMNAHSQKNQPVLQPVRKNRNAVRRRAARDAAGGMSPRKRRFFFPSACRERAAQETTANQMVSAAMMHAAMMRQSIMPLF